MIKLHHQHQYLLWLEQHAGSLDNLLMEGYPIKLHLLCYFPTVLRHHPHWLLTRIPLLTPSTLLKLFQLLLLTMKGITYTFNVTLDITWRVDPPGDVFPMEFGQEIFPFVVSIRWTEVKILLYSWCWSCSLSSSSITLSVRAILCYSFICESCPSSLVLSSCFPSSSSCSVWVSLWFDLLPFLVHVLRFIRSQKWSLEIQEWKKCHSNQSDRSRGWTKESPFIASFLTREVIICSRFLLLFLTTFHDFLNFTSCLCISK